MAYMDINLLGAAFTDLLVSDTGAPAFGLDHDWFTAEDLVIRTAAGGGGTALAVGVDYQLVTQDIDLSARVTVAVGVARTVYKQVQIINAIYQAGDLYISGKYIADSNVAADVDYRANKAVSGANYTVRDTDGYGRILVTTGAADRTITLPTAAANTGREILVMKVDTGAGKVIVAGEGGETINGAATVNLVSQYDRLRVFCTGTGWIILDIRATKESAYINCSDWTNQLLGDAVGGNIVHGLGVALSELRVKLILSTDGTDATSFEVGVTCDAGAASYGCTPYYVDANTIKIQTGDAGLTYQPAGGSAVVIDNENWHYKYRVDRIA